MNGPVKDAWKRERPAHQQPPPTLNVDVHGVLFAVAFVVFVVYDRIHSTKRQASF